MITADTITDEQIRELRATFEIDATTFTLAVIGKMSRPREHAKARARCAEILNARAASKAGAK